MRQSEVTEVLEAQEDRTWWYFTFGCGQKHAGHYVMIFGTFDEARQKMFERYGSEWCRQYSEAEWKRYEEKCRAEHREWMIETELDNGA